MDLLELVVKLVFDSKEYDEGLKKTEEKAKKTQNKLSDIFGKIAAITAKAVAAATATAATGITAMVKQSVSAYGQYEQLAGGIDKLFGKSSEKLKLYAEEAYKTSGMSANQYFQNVTGFSAALINSLGGDTDQAVKLADKAMRDISDNANTYGKYTVEEIANVYQALAKGNYQTLDNLNLGFGGTKEGMQQLITKAEQLDSTFKANRDENGKLTMSFNDMINAIHIVQENMNITGTTSKEAAKTIEGSAGAMKAAWNNLVRALSAKPEDNLNISTYVDNFIASAEAAYSNLVPTVERALNGVGELIDKFAPTAIQKITNVLNDISPSILKSATSLVTSILKAIGDENNLKTALNAVQMIIQNILPVISEMLPDIITVLADVLAQLIIFISTNLKTLVNPIINKLPEIISSIFTAIISIVNNLPEIFDSVMAIIDKIADVLIDAIPTLVEASLIVMDKVIDFVTEPENLEKIFEMVVKIVIALSAALLASTPKILVGVGQIIKSVADNITKTDWTEVGKTLFNNISIALKNASDKLSEWWDGWSQQIGKYAKIGWDSVVQTWSAVGQWFLDRWEDIKRPFVIAAQWFGEVFTNALNGIKTAFSAVGGFFVQVWDGIKGTFSNVVGWFSDIFTKAWDGIKNVFAPVGQTFQNIGDSILNGLKSIVNGLITGINNVITIPFDGLNSALRSIRDIDIIGNKPFSWLGDIPVPQIPYLAKGGVLKKGQMAFLEGQGDEAVIPLSQNTEWIDKIANRLGNSLTSSKTNPLSFSVVIENFVNNRAEDIDELTERIFESLTENMNRRGLVYA